MTLLLNTLHLLGALFEALAKTGFWGLILISLVVSVMVASKYILLLLPLLR